MKHAWTRRFLLLLATSLGCLSGCFGLEQNPSHFPYLWPTTPVVPTHAKPGGPGYYADFDPNAVILEVRPLDSTNPVRSQHVLIATIKDKDATPRRGRRVEWMIEGVGNIIEVDESGWFHRGYKTGRQHAVSATALLEHRVTRGNENPNDDFVIRPGQTWCILSSAVEGDTHVTVYAPGVANWEKSKVYTTLHWVDAAWEMPPPAQARSGTQHVFTTRIFRHTDKQPLANYRVRYKILDGGPPAAFIPSQTQEYLAISDLAGNAQVAIGQLAPAFGVNRIAIEIIRPPDPSTPSGSGITIGRGETSIEWLAPAVALAHTGPSMTIFGSEATYETTVTNTGKVESKSMTVSSAVPDGMQYVRSNPPAFLDGRNLVWAMGTLPAGQAHKVQAVYKTLRQGQITSCASVTTEEGFKDEKCVTTSVTTAGLKVNITGPQTGLLGSPITFQVTITNPGNGPLENLLLTASYSEGLEHETKARTLNLPLGTIAGQENRTIPLVLTARQPGNQTVQIMATSGSLSDQTQTAVMIQQPQVSLSIDGPRSKYVGRPAEWTLVLANPSETVLNNVVVRDRLPFELDFVGADQGGKLENGQVLWTIGQLQPRERRILKLTTTGKAPAKAAVQVVTASADPGIHTDAQAMLEILATPAAFKLEMEDRGDPVQVGKTVTYVIKVTNTGQQPANQVEIKAVVPPELKIVDAKGPSPGTVTGQMVTFGKLDNVEKDRPLEYTIEAQAQKSGDVRFRVELRAQGLDPREPVMEEESTRIFDTGQAAPPPPVPPPPGPGL